MYLDFPLEILNMAMGPKCADNAQRYILQIMQNSKPIAEYGDIVDTSEDYDGEVEWSIGSVFDDGNLETFEEEEDKDFEAAQKAFESLDEIYDALKTTNSNSTSYSKLEGLKAFSERYDAEIPTNNRSTRNNWIHDYRDAGLLDVGVSKESSSPIDEGEVTDLGHEFIRSTERLEAVFSDVEISAGDFYRKIFDRGYGDREPHSGEKIKAFFLYGSGMSHTEIADELEVPESTVRGLATDLREEDILTENYMFTKTGRDIAQRVLTQVDLAEPQEFEGGTVETELGQEKEGFFDDDGMLDI